MKSILRVAILIFSCVQLILASSQHPQDLDTGCVLLLHKSIQSQEAMLKRDEDHREYLLKIRDYIAGQDIPFEPGDKVFQSVCADLMQLDGRRKIEMWCEQSLTALKQNIATAHNNILLYKEARSPESIERIFDYCLNGMNRYFERRSEMRIMGITMPSTRSQDFYNLNPMSQLSAQSAIDRHASLCEVIKQAYKVLLKVDQVRAELCLAKIKPDTFLSKYLRGNIAYVMDPDSSHLHDYGAHSRFDGGARGASATTDRLRQKLAQRQGVPKSNSSSRTRTPAHKGKQKGRGPSKDDLAVIKHAIDLEKEMLEQKEAEKQARREAQAAHAQHMKELLHQARLEALRSDSETTLPAPSSALESTSPSKKRVKEKTKGVQDVNKRQRKGDPRALAKSKAKARTSSGEKEEPREEETQLAANLYKRLEAFWESKAGQTYHDVTQLFRGFGGRVTQKNGGSSHVTLTYYGAGGHKLKHELWRPHGGDNTFGFRTTAALQAFFEKCGLTLH